MIEKLKNKSATTLRSAYLACIATLLITGCAPLAVVGIGTGIGAAALMTADRRSGDNYLLDQSIEISVLRNIRKQFPKDRVHVNATSYNLNLLLTGEAPDKNTIDAISRTARQHDKVKKIYNRMVAAGPSGYASRANDTFITTKVKGRILDSKEVSANHVKVVTEKQVVYLLGLLTRQEEAAAIRITRTTSGVGKVVNLISILTPEQTRRLKERKAQATSRNKSTTSH